MLNSVQLFATSWTVTLQTPLSMRFPRQENWSGLPFPFPQALSDSGIKPSSLMSSALQADSLPLVPPGNTKQYGGALKYYIITI